MSKGIFSFNPFTSILFFFLRKDMTWNKGPIEITQQWKTYFSLGTVSNMLIFELPFHVHFHIISEDFHLLYLYSDPMNRGNTASTFIEQIITLAFICFFSCLYSQWLLVTVFPVQSLCLITMYSAEQNFNDSLKTQKVVNHLPNNYSSSSHQSMYQRGC